MGVFTNGFAPWWLVLLLNFILLPHLSRATRATAGSLWQDSASLSRWYTPYDLCVLGSAGNGSIESISEPCEKAAQARGETVPPVRCRVGNSWPSKGGFCSAVDIPYTERKNLRRSVVGLDDPGQAYLRELFTSLSREKGMLLLVGDSVMQQFFGAMACELEREGIWKDPSKFSNTDEVRHVTITPPVANSSSPAASVPIKFVPIYHFVNGRFDRVANASMFALRKNVDEYIRDHDSLLILINMGLHYVSSPIAHFTRADYRAQMTAALSYLNGVAHAYPTRRVRVIWRETSAQHFPTPTGYWPGARYAPGMKVGCVPIKEPGPEADWRNADIRDIVRVHNLDRVKIAPFYNITVPLWSEHVNGHLRDCTHFCWTPMLYQSLFKFLADECRV